MGSVTSRKIDQVVFAAEGLLREHGMRRRERTFARAAGDLHHVLWFQANKWNTPEQASFTINLHVVLPAFHEALLGAPFPKRIAHAAPVIRDRVQLSGDQGEWWALGPETPTEELSTPVLHAIRTAALPFFDGYPSSQVLLERILRGDTPPGARVYHPRCAALLLRDAGRSDEARAVLRGMITGDAVPGFADSIREFAERLGLSLDDE